MLGHPASSQTVCRPSRRTRDFSSVYSGPVRSLVLIHSGLRSMGVWLLRTSRRSSLRPAGSIPEAGCGGPAGASSMPRLMGSTVLPATSGPRVPGTTTGPSRIGWAPSGERCGAVSARAVLTGTGAPAGCGAAGGAGAVDEGVRRGRGHRGVGVVGGARGGGRPVLVAGLARTGGRLCLERADAALGRAGVRRRGLRRGDLLALGLGRLGAACGGAW